MMRTRLPEKSYRRALPGETRQEALEEALDACETGLSLLAQIRIETNGLERVDPTRLTATCNRV